jgi:hypothetical protein
VRSDSICKILGATLVRKPTTFREMTVRLWLLVFTVVTRLRADGIWQRRAPSYGSQRSWPHDQAPPFTGERSNDCQVTWSYRQRMAHLHRRRPKNGARNGSEEPASTTRRRRCWHLHLYADTTRTEYCWSSEGALIVAFPGL